MTLKEKATAACGPIKALVHSTDPRRGTAVLVDEKGRRIRVPWEVLQHAPVLLRGTKPTTLDPPRATARASLSLL
jgi:hypothetical protein